ncbi:biogenesis of lysosome-related organelles complex 1 subunit 2 isoform X4 [Bubalus kerabau]|uniref:biogenesis of lysosome-related organelles complex 1 subunit 2 isoform X4 n=1 Tax=Bubalus bubalis TaxID=89462 RepID=UPI001E1B7A2B|nr:biogenesis of lysosome-related organelles complex 1 subunit 2 isoform X4 [Bubalus bubalis]XP_055416535.1 biogenesis of lysosome-related organelles complex 1 subunit 2 isoform X4 [Bubalus carabanensis]
MRSTSQPEAARGQGMAAAAAAAEGVPAIHREEPVRATSEDYKLLENMNKLTSLKYLEMKDIAINISRNLKDLNQKYAGLQPYLDQINIIEEQVAALEQAAYKLDAYSKKLGMWDLSSPTRDQACALCIGRSQVQEAGEAMKNNCGDKVFFNVERMFYKT